MPRRVWLWAGLLALRAGAAVELVSEGRPVATVVLPAAPLPAEVAAAEELRYHLQRASGAVLPLVREPVLPDGNLVLLGATAAAREAGLTAAGLAPNHALLRQRGPRLFLVGDDSPGEVFWIQHGNRTRVGTLFAVYALLEQELGCRWLWPGPLGEVIPPRREVVIRRADQELAPPFLHTRWRDGSYGAAAAGWADQRHRSQFLNEQGKWLRRHRFAMGVNLDMAHSYTDWWQRFGKDHPEYFNLLPDGTRRGDPTYFGAAPSLIAMCVSAPGVARQKVADWAARRGPDRPYVDASENDTPGRCTCAGCLALDEPDPGAASVDERLAAARTAFAAGQADWVDQLGSLSDRYARFYLAIQREAEQIAPQAVVMGYAYANYVQPPRRTKLNERILIGIVPALMFPWTAPKRAAFREQWEGWSAAGARLLLRPNYLLDGHNLPLNVALPLGEDFRFAAQRGLVGTDFDSLTGQYATQGPTLYLLARLHDRPELTPEAVLQEYYAAFGPAAAAVRAYQEHWAAVSAAVTDQLYDEAKLHWSTFYQAADRIFTPAVMQQGQRLLAAAQTAATGDATAVARVAFLEQGLRHAELTLAVQVAAREYPRTGDLDTYATALDTLDRFRADVEDRLGANMAYLQWAESRTWDRALVKLMREPGTRLGDPWQFQWDPQRQGEAAGWFRPDHATGDWLSIQASSAWEEQPVGAAWRAAHGGDYDGLAWYRTSFSLPAAPADQTARILFGAVDEACRVWLNGQLLLTRPYPFEGDTESWKKTFELEVSAAVRRDGPNVLVVCVEDNLGAGGLWRPVWLLTSAPPAAAAANLLRDGGFEQGDGWRGHVQCGAFELARDTTAARHGQAAGRVRCTALAAEAERAAKGTLAWARWHQAVTVEPTKTYQLRVWYRTGPTFGGAVKVWVTGTTAGTRQAVGLNTGGLWRELHLPDCRPAAGEVGVYLNVMDQLGEVWFDDVELTPAG
ncbi:MAG: DUF4838 domain-containing protein [Fimbriimonadaceae bacterium]|nr:DUF4838 domain-containing protein [Fimbriimonadaceae bacterium]